MASDAIVKTTVIRQYFNDIKAALDNMPLEPIILVIDATKLCPASHAIPTPFMPNRGISRYEVKTTIIAIKAARKMTVFTFFCTRLILK